MDRLKNFNKILIAIDDSTFSEHAAAYGFTLARNLNATVGLVHVNEFPVPIVIGNDPLMGGQDFILPDLINIQQDSAEKLLTDFKSKFSQGEPVEEFIISGDVTTEIVAIAEEFGASLIVMGTHGKTGFDHFFSGSVAESVIRHAKCPVLIVPNKD